MPGGLSSVTVIIAVLAALALLALLWGLARMYRKVGPNEALVVFGFGGTHIVTGGGRVVWPMIQQSQQLSLELMSFDVAPKQDYYTSQGVAVSVEAVAQIKVKSDHESIRTAAEQFLTKADVESEALIKLVMEGHLRGIVGQLSVEQIVKEPEMVSEKVRLTCAEDLAKMGLELVSFTIREVMDKNDYIGNMGKPDTARIKRDADVAMAEAERDTAIKRALYMREAAQATAQADMETVQAQTASSTKQAEAVRDLEVKKAEYAATVSTQKASADKAYDIQNNIMEQQATSERVKIERIQREEQIKVQEAEIIRRERELTATVLKVAEMEKQKIMQLAEAERQRLSIEATGRAEARRAEAAGEADAIKATGHAEAEAIKAKGLAEAEAMNMKAEAFAGYNEAAIIDKFLENLPELARAISEPLNKVDKITVLSTGNGSGAGTDKVTEDIGKMMVQIPALFDTLTGVNFQEFIQRLPQVGGDSNGERAPVAKRDGNGTSAVVKPASASPKPAPVSPKPMPVLPKVNPDAPPAGDPPPSAN